MVRALVVVGEVGREDGDGAEGVGVAEDSRRVWNRHWISATR